MHWWLVVWFVNYHAPMIFNWWSLYKKSFAHDEKHGVPFCRPYMETESVGGTRWYSSFSNVHAAGLKCTVEAFSLCMNFCRLFFFFPRIVIPLKKKCTHLILLASLGSQAVFPHTFIFPLNPAFCWKRTLCCFRMCQMELCFPPPPPFCWPWHRLSKPDGYPHWASCKKRKRKKKDMWWSCKWMLNHSSYFDGFAILACGTVFLSVSACMAIAFVFYFPCLRQPAVSSRKGRLRDCGWLDSCSSSSFVSLVRRYGREREMCVNACPYVFIRALQH